MANLWKKIRKRINVKLINDSKEYLKCVSKPNFVSRKIFDKNFIAVHQIKTVLTNKKTNLCWILYFKPKQVINVEVSIWLCYEHI